MKTTLLFQILPYAAAAIAAAALFARAWQTPTPAAIATARARWGGGRAWLVSLVLLLTAHLLGVVSPRLLLIWNASPARLYVMEGAGLLIGLVALAGTVGVLVRQWRAARVGAGTEIADAALLSLALLALGSGLLTAVRLRWASSWATATLTPYLWSLLAGRPATGLVERLPPLVQLHVCAGFGALGLLGFSSLAPVVAMPLARPLQIGRRAVALAERRARVFVRKLDPAPWLWPDEDYGGPFVPSPTTEDQRPVLRPELGVELEPVAKR